MSSSLIGPVVSSCWKGGTSITFTSENKAWTTPPPPGPAERGQPRNLGSHSGCGLCRLIHSLSGAAPPCVVDDAPSACCLRILAWSASGRLSQGCPQGILSVCFLSALLQHAHLDTNGIKLLKGQKILHGFLRLAKAY